MLCVADNDNFNKIKVLYVQVCSHNDNYMVQIFLQGNFCLMINRWIIVTSSNIHAKWDSTFTHKKEWICIPTYEHSYTHSLMHTKKSITTHFLHNSMPTSLTLILIYLKKKGERKMEARNFTIILVNKVASKLWTWNLHPVKFSIKDDGI